MILLRYVAHEDVQFYEAEGWTIANALEGTYHGRFSVLMELKGSRLNENIRAQKDRTPGDA